MSRCLCVYGAITNLRKHANTQTRKHARMKKILITDGVHPMLLEGFQEMGFEVDYHPKISLAKVHDMIAPYEGMIINSKIICDIELLDKAKQLKFIGRLGSGMEIIDQVYAAQKGIAVFSAPDGNCDAVGEHALAMLLALANNSIQSDQQVRQKIWRREANRGFELAYKTIALIGFGHTGSAFARKLRGLDMTILVYDKYKTNYADDLDYVEESTMERIFKEADIVSFHLPLTEEVIHLADDNYFKKFKKNILLINTSRGKVIPTQTIINGLQSGKLTGACLDVFENEKPHTFTKKETECYNQLYQFPNVILSPHVAGWTVESKYKLSAILLKKIRKLYGLT